MGRALSGASRRRRLALGRAAKRRGADGRLKAGHDEGGVIGVGAYRSSHSTPDTKPSVHRQPRARKPTRRR